MAVGDRVQHMGTDRLGTVRGETYNPNGMKLTTIVWDAMGRLQEEHERMGAYFDGQFVYIGGFVTATQVGEAHEAARLAGHRRQMLIDTDPVMAFDLASESDRTAVMTFRMGGNGMIEHVNTERIAPRPAVDPVFNQMAIDLVQRGGLIQALLDADRAEVEAFRLEFQGLPGVPGMTGATGAMGAMGNMGPRGLRGRNFDDPTEEEERAERAFQQGVLDQSEDGPVISASAHAKAMQPKPLRPKLFGGKRRVTGLD